MSQTIKEINSPELEDALLRISKLTEFRVFYIDDTDVESAWLKDGRARLEFDFVTHSCSLITPIATMERNIIRAAAEIEHREMLISQTTKRALSLL